MELNMMTVNAMIVFTQLNTLNKIRLHPLLV